MVLPILTTTAPLACLASRPVSMESVLPPIVRSTVTGLRIAKEVLDMNLSLPRPCPEVRGLWCGRIEARRSRAQLRSIGSDLEEGRNRRDAHGGRFPRFDGPPRTSGPRTEEERPAGGGSSRPAAYLRIPRRPITS